MQEVGVFPLGLVLLPTQRLPLHIFEPRYRELIGECLAGGDEFGVLFEDEAGPRQVGTLSSVEEVVHRFDDGRLNVVVCGMRRFRLVDWTDGRSFRTARVEAEDDRNDPAEPAAAARGVELFQRLAKQTESAVEAPDPGSPQLSFELAARVDFGAPMKQELLETRSERLRLARVAELLESTLDALTLAREVNERASRNGKIFVPKE